MSYFLPFEPFFSKCTFLRLRHFVLPISYPINSIFSLAVRICKIHVFDEAFLPLNNRCCDNSLKVVKVFSKTNNGFTFNKTSRFSKKTVNVLMKNQ